MFKVSNLKIAEFRDLFETHRVNVSALNIYFENIRLLLNRHQYLDRKTYEVFFLNSLSDIELVSSPIDAIVPSDDPNTLFYINRDIPEYVEISKRLPFALIEETLGVTNPVSILLKDDINKLEIIHDDICLYFLVHKFNDLINIIRLNIFSNYTPVIEHVVNNFTINDWKNQITSKKKDTDKYAELFQDLIFNPDIASAMDFYYKKQTEEDEVIDVNVVANHVVPRFDVVDLLVRLSSNVVLKSDIIFFLAAYLIILFAMRDYMNESVETSPCMEYVNNVLSKI